MFLGVLFLQVSRICVAVGPFPGPWATKGICHPAVSHKLLFLQFLGRVPSSGDLDKLLAEVDSDGSGAIDYTEFLAATLDKKLYDVIACNSA